MFLHRTHGKRNCHNQGAAHWERRAVASIDSRHSHAVIRDPERPGAAGGKSPGVHQIGIGEGGHARDIRHQIGLREERSRYPASLQIFEYRKITWAMAAPAALLM